MIMSNEIPEIEGEAETLVLAIKELLLGKQRRCSENYVEWIQEMRTKPKRLETNKKGGISVIN